jgi:hypothetical protein
MRRRARSSCCGHEAIADLVDVDPAAVDDEGMRATPTRDDLPADAHVVDLALDLERRHVIAFGHE